MGPKSSRYSIFDGRELNYQILKMLQTISFMIFFFGRSKAHLFVQKMEGNSSKI